MENGSRNKSSEGKAELKHNDKTEDMVVSSTALHDSSPGISWIVEGASLCYICSIIEIC